MARPPRLGGEPLAKLGGDRQKWIRPAAFAFGLGPDLCRGAHLTGLPCRAKTGEEVLQYGLIFCSGQGIGQFDQPLLGGPDIV